MPTIVEENDFDTICEKEEKRIMMTVTKVFIVAVATAAAAAAFMVLATDPIVRLQTLEIPDSRSAWYAILYHQDKLFVGTSSRHGSVYAIGRTTNDGVGEDLSQANNEKKMILDPNSVRKVTTIQGSHNGAVQNGKFGFFFGPVRKLVTEFDLETEVEVAAFTGFDEHNEPVHEIFSREVQNNESRAISFTACGLWNENKKNLLCATFPQREIPQPAFLFNLDAGTLKPISAQSLAPLVRFGEMVAAIVGHPKQDNVVFLMTQSAVFKMQMSEELTAARGVSRAEHEKEPLAQQLGSLLVGKPLTRDKFQHMHLFSRCVVHQDLLWVTGASASGYALFSVDVSDAASALNTDDSLTRYTMMGTEGQRAMLMDMKPHGGRFMYLTDPGKARVLRFDILRRSWYTEEDDATEMMKKRHMLVPVMARAEMEEAQLWGIALDEARGLLFTSSGIDPTDITVFQLNEEEGSRKVEKGRSSPSADL